MGRFAWAAQLNKYGRGGVKKKVEYIFLLDLLFWLVSRFVARPCFPWSGEILQSEMSLSRGPLLRFHQHQNNFPIVLSSAVASSFHHLRLRAWQIPKKRRGRDQHIPCQDRSKMDGQEVFLCERSKEGKIATHPSRTTCQAHWQLGLILFVVEERMD